MKDRIVDANFPRTLDQRVYHLGLRAGEVANRIITVGSPSRAAGIARYLDPLPTPFTISSERGFTTITGRYRNVPVSVVSIGMGSSNADFFVREVRECLNGDMVVVRLGSCGALIDVPVGTVVVPKASIAVTRNYDFDFADGSPDETPYRISRQVGADPALHDALRDALQQTRPPAVGSSVVDNVVNASTDSFYSSQGRQTSFPDHNNALIAQLRSSHADLATFEMETFHILHLAASWRPSPRPTAAASPPLSALPVSPVIHPPHSLSTQIQHTTPRAPPLPGCQEPRIKAAAAQMVFAARASQDFITPERVLEIEAWCGRAVLDALTGFHIAPEKLHEEVGSVWQLK